MSDFEPVLMTPQDAALMRRRLMRQFIGRGRARVTQTDDTVTIDVSEPPAPGGGKGAALVPAMVASVSGYQLWVKLIDDTDYSPPENAEAVRALAMSWGEDGDHLLADLSTCLPILREGDLVWLTQRRLHVTAHGYTYEYVCVAPTLIRQCPQGGL